MSQDKPTTIPLAIVPALLGRSKATISRWAAGQRWPLVVWPGRVRGHHVPVADLEARFGVTFTAEQLEAATDRHERQLRSAHEWRERVAVAAEALKRPLPASASLGAVADLFSDHHHTDRAMEDAAQGYASDDPPRV